MQKILVTGGSGFIGSNTIQFFSNKGYDILNIDSNAPQNLEHKKYWKNVDILAYTQLEKEIIDFLPDFIIHMAARTDLAGQKVENYTSNTNGTENLIKVCQKVPNLKRVIFTSSMLVCQPGYTPQHPTDYAPSTKYGESKVKMEEIIRAQTLNFEWAIVRPTSIWGPGFGVPYRNFFDMLMNRRYYHIGNTACTKTYGFIGNVVYQIDSILNAPIEKVNKQVFYLGDYEPTNIKEWANEIGNELGMKIKTVPFPLIKLAAWGGDLFKQLGIRFPMTSFRLKNMTTNNVVDLSNTKEIAPNLPTLRIEGIRKTLDWLNENK